jgi:sulfatase modifying factor 1
MDALRVGRLLCVLLFISPLARADESESRPVTVEMVTVRNPGNAADPATGGLYGSVDYEFRIGKYCVTISQYTEFLNTVDPEGINPYGLYSEGMQIFLNVAGIAFEPTQPTGMKYAVMNNGGFSGNRPITFVSWFDAARFANWMHNGQGSGGTETGAYTLIAGQTSGTAPAKNVGAQFYIPTENEWYKAAYYSPLLNSGSGGYFAYATQGDSAPGNNLGSESNQANYVVAGLYSVTASSVEDPSQNYLTDVGAFINSASFYGTFDQSGNVYQWNDLTGTDGSLTTRGVRGGSWGDWDGGGYDTGVPLAVSSSRRLGGLFAGRERNVIGFRVASPVAVPEPSTCVMAIGGLACIGCWMRRKRRKSVPKGFTKGKP